MDYENQFAEEKSRLGDVVVLTADALEAETRALVNQQVATAKQYPRNLPLVLKNIEFLATQDKDTAESCFYALRRQGKTISGASVRFAEIITNCWGNLRSQARITANDGKMITAQGVCWDLENNVAYSVEVRRRITTKEGIAFSEDMQIVTANAACSIALRNAVFKVIPMAITTNIQNRIKDVILGKKEDFEQVRTKAVKYFMDKGITKKQILKLLDREQIEDMTRDDVFTLRGIVTAIEEGDTTLSQAFEIKKGNALNKINNLNFEIPEDEESNQISEQKVNIEGFEKSE